MKKVLRKQILAARDALSPEERRKKSGEIEERLFSLPEFKSSRLVMFFASFRSEVDTIPMIRRALSEGKRVVLPKVKGRDLAPYEIRDFEKDVFPGAWGIPEPRETRPAGLADADIIIVPGAAFDERGNRIGYGAGYYDKLLTIYKGITIALAFEAQMTPVVPKSAHDVPVMKIVTEKRIININTKS